MKGPWWMRHCRCEWKDGELVYTFRFGFWARCYLILWALWMRLTERFRAH